ncbi:MAG: hypothetical protein Q9157_002104 [Trypethelium eluteriae]
MAIPSEQYACLHGRWSYYSNHGHHDPVSNGTPVTDQDLSGSIWYSILMQAIETPLGIICTCVPTLPPVWGAFKESKPGMYAMNFLSSVWSRSTLGSSKDSSRSPPGAKFSNSKDFQRLDGSYAANVDALRRGDRSCQEDVIPLNDFEANQRTAGYGNGTIQVEKSWNVDR